MAGYTRQSSFSDGDTITAALFNNEYNQLVNAFNVSSGHTHDGSTTGDGGPISNLFSNALVFGTNTDNDIAITFNASTNDGVLTWKEDEDYFEFSDDLLIATTEKIQFRDTAIYINSSTDGQLDLVADTEIQIAATTIDINGAADISGNLAVGGNLTVTGTTTFNGGTITMGDAATDNVVFGADVDSNIIPDDDDTYDLGSSSQEWRDLYIDGTAHIDTLDVDINATVAGTLGVTGIVTLTDDLIIGDGKTIGSASDVDAMTIAANGQVTFSQTLIGTALDISGDIDVDGTTNLDVVDIDGAVDMATTLTVGGEITAASLDISGNVDIDGTLETDALSINGTTVTSTAAELNILDGVTASATDINLIDGITNGTVIASKAIVTDANKDITGGRNITITGELDAATLDISGNADIDGTLETDALSINGTTVTSTAAELNILDGVTSTAAELNLLDGVTSTTAELNILDGVTSTTAELNILDGVTSTATELNLLDGVTATTTELNYVDVATAGTVEASKAIVVDSNKDFTGARNITITGELDAATLDVSGDVDIDGTLEADAITVNGTTLAETISDTVGAMVTSNTESGITVAYDDSDNTLDFTVGTLNQDTTGTAATATLATTVTVSDSTANTNFPVVFHDESNALLDDTGALRYNPSTGELLVPKLTVAGTTTQVDTVTMEAANAIIFEGATADSHETTLSIVDPTADHTQYLINQGGYIPVLAAATTTAITSTPEELNILDGVTSTTAELNILDGVTSTATELNILDGVTSTTAELNILDGVTSTTAELNILDGVTSTTAELNILDGVTATATELNYSDGVTSNIQTQLDTKTSTGKAIAMAIVFG